MLIVSLERTAQNSLHTLLVLVFHQHGGVAAILEMGQRCIDSIDRLHSISQEEHGPDTEKELAYSFSAVNVVVHLLHMLVSSRPLLESPQTTPLITRDKPKSDPSYFEPHEFLVRMRLVSLPFLLRVWQSSWLSSAPLAAIKSVLKTMVEIAAAENEEMSPEEAVEAQLNGTAPVPTRQGPDEASITQLVDMGFSRASVERALIRTRNNVNGAAELLLNHPYLFVNVADEGSEEIEENPTTADEDQTPDTPDNAPADENVNPPMEVDQTIEQPPADAPQPESSTPNPPAEPQVPPQPLRNWKEELDTVRKDLRTEVVDRAFSLLDQHPGLVFEAKTAFVRVDKSDRNQSGLLTLLGRELPSVLDEEAREDVLATRCRLLALILNDTTFATNHLSEADSELLMNTLTTFLDQIGQSDALKVVPKWMASHLLAMEALLILGEGISNVSVPSAEEDITAVQLYTGPRHEEARKHIFAMCLKLLRVVDVSRDTMLANLRMLVLLTRDQKYSTQLVQQSGLNILLDRFNTTSKEVLGYRGHVFIILRHVIEDLTTIEAIITTNLKRYFQMARTRSVDVSTLLRNTGPLVLRDPQAFLLACQASCRMSPPRSSSGYTLALKPEDPIPRPQDQNEANAGAEGMQIDDVIKQEGPSPHLSDTLTHYLMAELLRIGKSAVAASSTPLPTASVTPSITSTSQNPNPLPAPPSEPAPPPSLPDNLENSDYLYACVLMQCLAELLSSYDSCKQSFVTYHKKKPTPGQQSKQRSSVLNFLLLEVLSSTPGLPGADVQKKASLSTWATAVIVSLCLDVSYTSPGRDVSDELAVVRKFVLDAIAKTIKEIPPNDAPELRYGKLYALSDLCFRLLSPRAPSTPGSKEETSIHIAKVMLEKNYVALLTGALADADLNYPGMKNLVGAVMRPLEQL